MSRQMPVLVPDPAPTEERGIRHESAAEELAVHPTWDPVRDASSRIAAAMLDAADPRTGEHSDDVELLAGEICRRLDVTGREREHVLVGARLHDVGKVSVPREVLDKPGPLDEAEWGLMRKHTVVGERILRSIAELHSAARLVRHSHEHFDGSGYPDGLRGEEIPVGSRIILCADAFHAIRSDRAYRRGRTTAEALVEMRACVGGQFDPAVVEALSSTIADAGRGHLRRRAPRRLLVLVTTLAIGGSGAYAAERGWIDTPLAGIGGGDRSTDVVVPPPDRVVEPTTGAGTQRGATRAGAADGKARDPATGVSGSGDAGPRAGGARGPSPAAASSGSGSSSASPGKSGAAPGHSGSSPGSSGTAPGQTGSTPHDSGSAPGHSGSLPGELGPLPGQPAIPPDGGSLPEGSAGSPGIGSAPGPGAGRSDAAPPAGNPAPSDKRRPK